MTQTLKQKQAISAYAAHRSRRSEFRQIARSSGRQLDMQPDAAVQGANPHNDSVLSVVLFIVLAAAVLVIGGKYLGIYL